MAAREPNREKLLKFEMDYAARSMLDLAAKFRILDAMYSEARALGIFPLKNALEGIERDIALSDKLRSVRTTPR